MFVFVLLTVSAAFQPAINLLEAFDIPRNHSGPDVASADGMESQRSIRLGNYLFFDSIVN